MQDLPRAPPAGEEGHLSFWEKSLACFYANVLKFYFSKIESLRTNSFVGANVTVSWLIVRLWNSYLNNLLERNLSSLHFPFEINSKL